MIKEHRQKEIYTQFCESALHDQEIHAEKDSTARIKVFLSLKKASIRDFEEKEDQQLIIDEIEEKLNKEIDRLENDLMEIELLLQVAIGDATSTYVSTINTKLDSMKERFNIFLDETPGFKKCIKDDFFTTIKIEVLAEVEKY